MISVIIPIYNSAAYMRATIDNVLDSSYKNIELLLIDDGSSDNSWEICKEYENEYNNIRAFHMENGGVSRARNFGLQEAKGDYIAFVDSDDRIDKYMFSLLLEDMCSSKADLATGKIVSLTLEDYSRYKDISSNEIINIDDPITVYYDNEWFGDLKCKLYKRSFIEGLSFEIDMQYGEDMYFVAQYMMKCSKMVYRNKVVYYRIERLNSLAWQDGTIESWYKYLGSRETLYKQISSEMHNKNLTDLAFDDYGKAILSVYRFVVHKRLKVDFDQLDKNYGIIAREYIRRCNFGKRLEYMSFVYSYNIATLFHKKK